MSRRDFLRGSALFGASAMVSEVLLTATGAAQAAKPAVPASADAASSVAAPYGPGSARGSVADVYQNARKVLYPICRVCPACDGVACAGEFPGMGGLGSGMSFQNNFHALQAVHFKLRALNGVSTQDKKPDTSTVILGKKLSLPAVAAPIGGNDMNFRSLLPDAEYFDRIIGGCVDAGTMGAIGDVQTDKIQTIKARYAIIAKYQGNAVAGIKPRPQQSLLSIVKLAEAANSWIITIDIDSAGRYKGNPRDYAVEPKTVAQLREIVRFTSIPVIVKGITTLEDALLVAETGAAGICVSNHGGRVLDNTLGTADLLPAIADKMKGKMVIFVDGCVHYGDDVLKYVALGADCVMVGRHMIRAAFGGGRTGVGLFMNTMRDELEASMVVTSCPDVHSIGRQILA